MQAKVTKTIKEIKRDMYDITFRVQLDVAAPKEVLEKIYINYKDKEYSAAELVQGINADTLTDAVQIAAYALEVTAMVLTKKHKPMNLDITINIAD